MALGLIFGIDRAFRRKLASSLGILSSKRGPRDYYKGKNWKPTGFHTEKVGTLWCKENRQTISPRFDRLQDNQGDKGQV